MVSVGRHPNITLLSYSEVEKVSGYVGNFDVTRAPQAALCERRAVHRLRDLRRKMPLEEDPLRVRPRAGQPPGDLLPLPPGGAARAGHRYRELCLSSRPANAGPAKSSARAMRSTSSRRSNGWSSRSARSSWPPASRTSTRTAHRNMVMANWTNVLTGMEFERLINSGGPTTGEVLLKNGRQAEKDRHPALCGQPRRRITNIARACAACIRSNWPTWCAIMWMPR